ncbi:hypothetical protein ACQP3J_32340, partial [Escherichia coli]
PIIYIILKKIMQVKEVNLLGRLVRCVLAIFRSFCSHSSVNIFEVSRFRSLTSTDIGRTLTTKMPDT